MSVRFSTSLYAATRARNDEDTTSRWEIVEKTRQIFLIILNFVDIKDISYHELLPFEPARTADAAILASGAS
jgi:hypothetical protein